jgi:hypothetical protein
LKGPDDPKLRGYFERPLIHGKTMLLQPRDDIGTTQKSFFARWRRLTYRNGLNLANDLKIIP